MARRHHVVLIPGFLGFANLGGLRYFVGVREALERHFDSYGLEAEVHEVVTLPTASIRHRAARVLEVVEEVSAEDDGPVHLIGHSTGGLDARLAIVPTASLPTRSDPRDAYARVRSLVSVSTPHHGTPLASFYGGAMGKPLLRLLAVATVYIMRYGKLPLSAAIRLAGLFTKLDDVLGLNETIADQVYHQLLADFSDARRRELIRFVEEVSSDQSLIFQLTPSGIDLFNATTLDPKGIRYGSVVTRARPPRAWTMVEHAHDVYAQSMHLVFAGLWLITARSRPVDLPVLEEGQQHALRRTYGELPMLRDSDGIVPTLSQVWGPVIHAAAGDHLDVVGHFGRPRESDAVHADWLPTGTGFDPDAFDALWRDIARFVCEAAEHSSASEGLRERATTARD